MKSHNLTDIDCADMLGCSTRSIYNWKKEGSHIPLWVHKLVQHIEQAYQFKIAIAACKEIAFNTNMKDFK